MVRTVQYLLLIMLLTSCEKIDLSALETPEESTTSPGASTGTIPSWFYDVEDTLYLSSIPEVPAFINGYIITHISGDKALLLSTVEWGNIPSAFNATNPTAAHDTAIQYTEPKVLHWQIPNEAQARSLKDITPLLQQLLKDSVTPIYLTDSKGTNVRYLCSNAERTFSFTSGSTILKAGTTVKYHLRLVSPVILRHTLSPVQIDIPY